MTTAQVCFVSAVAFIFAGQVMVGASVSVTVTVNEQLGPPSAVQVTVVVPTENEPDAGAQLTSLCPEENKCLKLASSSPTVTCTATDASKNTGTCSFTVTVIQKGDCTITCPANITKSNDSNQCRAVVSYSAPGTTGDCGTVICSPSSCSFFDKGTTTVTCTTTAGPSCSHRDGRRYRAAVDHLSG